MAEFKRCGEFRTGRTSRDERTVSWCAIAASDRGCNGYLDGCPTPEKYTPLVESHLKHRYPEPIRTGSSARKTVMLPVSGYKLTQL
jgi:hypothetical protein